MRFSSDVGPKDGYFGRNFRKKGRDQFRESSCADLDSDKTGTPPADTESDAGPFTKAKCTNEEKALAGKAKQGQDKALEQPTVSTRKKAAAEGSSTQRKLTVEAVKEGIGGGVISDKVVIVQTQLKA